MPNVISEDDLERAMVQRLQHLYGYDVQECYTADPADLNDGSGRADKREVILRDRLKTAAIGLNPDIPESAIDEALNRLCDRRQTMPQIVANRELGLDHRSVHQGARASRPPCGPEARVPRPDWHGPNDDRRPCSRALFC